jgi:hypothetical protein
MSFINRLKSKIQPLKTYSVTQEITLPIYESNLNGLVDPVKLGEKCLSIQQIETVDLTANPVLSGAWKSPYYKRSDVKFEEFSNLFNAVEDKLNSLPAFKKSEMRFYVHEWWFIIYTKGASINWHGHSPRVDTFTRFSATYYPIVPENTQPLLFKDKDEILEIPVTQNKLVFFPSVVYHSVSEVISSEPRIMIGFNFMGLS